MKLVAQSMASGARMLEVERRRAAVPLSGSISAVKGGGSPGEIEVEHTMSRQVFLSSSSVRSPTLISGSMMNTTMGVTSSSLALRNGSNSHSFGAFLASIGRPV